LARDLIEWERQIYELAALYQSECVKHNLTKVPTMLPPDS
jgi:hypothetical protein